jgi:hypothetical protein
MRELQILVRKINAFLIQNNMKSKALILFLSSIILYSCNQGTVKKDENVNGENPTVSTSPIEKEVIKNTDSTTVVNIKDSIKANHHYICYTFDNNKDKRIWIEFTEDGKATRLKYQGQKNAIDLDFQDEDSSQNNAYPTTVSTYKEMINGKINGVYTLSHGGVWDYVNYKNATSSKEFNFTIDHEADPYGKTPCF